MKLLFRLIIIIALAKFGLPAASAQNPQPVNNQTAPQVLKVEPPNWWANHSINPVRLLVRGTNLQGARVASTRPETVASSVVVNGAGTYLFVSVEIKTGARVGDYP